MTVSFFTSTSSFGLTVLVTMNGGVDGITGSTTKTSNATTFQATGFQYTITGSRATGTGAGAGKTQITPIGITKTLDSTSPTLFQAAFSGVNFSSVVLRFYNQN